MRVSFISEEACIVVDTITPPKQLVTVSGKVGDVYKAIDRMTRMCGKNMLLVEALAVMATAPLCLQAVHPENVDVCVNKQAIRTSLEELEI